LRRLLVGQRRSPGGRRGRCPALGLGKLRRRRRIGLLPARPPPLMEGGRRHLHLAAVQVRVSHPDLVHEAPYELAPTMTTSHVTDVPAPELTRFSRSPVFGVTATPPALGSCHQNMPPGLTGMPSPAARNSGAPDVLSRTTLTLLVLPGAARTSTILIRANVSVVPNGPDNAP